MRRIGIGVAVVAGLLTACGGGAGTADGAVTVLAKADGWRESHSGYAYALVEVATDPATAQQAWDDNVPGSLPAADGSPAAPGIYAPLDSVDFDEQAVVVFSSGESGTCPTWVTDLEFVEDRVEIRLAPPSEQACTDDFNPYRLVLAVDRDRLPPPAALPVERVDVPSENLTDVEGRVVAYPAEPQG